MALSYSFDDLSIEDLACGKGVKWSVYGKDVIPLWIAEPDFRVHPLIKEALIKAVEEEDLFYSSNEAFCEAAANKIREVNGVDIKPENIYVTQGVLPALWLAIKATCREGDEVVVTDPMFYPFFTAVEVAGTKPLYWRLSEEEGYRFDIDELNELITSRAKLIFVCNPHNPTGRVMTREELKGIGELAVDRGIYVMVDELWEDIRFDGRPHISLASLSPEVSDMTMTAWGFSKTFGVAGLQIGYLGTTNDALIEKIRKVARGVLRGATTLSKAAGIFMLSGKLNEWVTSLVQYLEELRDFTEERFREMDIVCPKLEGTYLMFPNISNYKMSSEEMAKYLLEEAHVAVSNGARFGEAGEGHVRICIATSKAILSEALNRIEKALSKLK